MGKPFALEMISEKNGIYLSQQQIDLLTIVSIESKENLKDFFEKCGQFPYQKINEVIGDIGNMTLEDCKHKLFDQYRETLITYIENGTMNMFEKGVKKLEKIGLSKDDIESITPFLNEGFDKNGAQGFFKVLKDKYGDDFVKKYNHLMLDDFENIKDDSITYEIVEELDRTIREDSSIDTLVIATGKNMNCVNETGEGKEFDPFYLERALDYCKSTGKHMRYHTLFDYSHARQLKDSGKGKDNKDEILIELRDFVKNSMEFINTHNDTMSDGSKRINVIEVFNELVEYHKPEKEREYGYAMVWEKYFGITMQDIMECFDGIEKPDGVEYMYNETEVEECDKRREKIENVFDSIQGIDNDFLDIFATQMHLSHQYGMPQTEENPYGKLHETEGALRLVKRIGEKGVKTECSEFDLHIDESTVEKAEQLIRRRQLSRDDCRKKIADIKRKSIENISDVAKSIGVTFSRISYWTVLDGADHNLVRANKSRYSKGETLLPTMFGGLYGDGQNLGNIIVMKYQTLHKIKEKSNPTVEIDETDIAKQRQRAFLGPRKINTQAKTEARQQVTHYQRITMQELGQENEGHNNYGE